MDFSRSIIGSIRVKENAGTVESFEYEYKSSKVYNGISHLDDDLIEYNRCKDGYLPPLDEWIYPCRICGNHMDVGAEIDLATQSFDVDMAYCGGSPSCCP